MILFLLWNQATPQNQAIPWSEQLVKCVGGLIVFAVILIALFVLVYVLHDNPKKQGR